MMTDIQSIHNYSVSYMMRSKTQKKTLSGFTVENYSTELPKYPEFSTPCGWQSLQVREHMFPRSEDINGYIYHCHSLRYAL